MTRSRNLVVVRCGDQSLHPGWLTNRKDWDFAVSYFGSDDKKTFDQALHVHRYKGGKWDGLHDFFLSYPDCLTEYDYVWLPDDDIKADGASIDAMFAAMRQYELELAQPSLSPASYLSHLISLNNRCFTYRNVNLIEIMVPVLDRRLLAIMLPFFEHSRTGFGFDFVWHRFTSDPGTKVAILDAVQVTHTRPVGGPLSRLIADNKNETAEQEQDRFLAPYGDIDKTELVFGGQLRSGRRIRQPRLAATIALAGWFLRPKGNHGFRENVPAWRFMIWVVRNWLGNMTTSRQLSKLPPKTVGERAA